MPPHLMHRIAALPPPLPRNGKPSDAKGVARHSVLASCVADTRDAARGCWCRASGTGPSVRLPPACGLLAEPSGRRVLRGSVTLDPSCATVAAEQLASTLMRDGAGEILAALRERKSVPMPQPE